MSKENERLKRWFAETYGYELENVHIVECRGELDHFVRVDGVGHPTLDAIDQYLRRNRRCEWWTSPIDSTQQRTKQRFSRYDAGFLAACRIKP